MPERPPPPGGPPPGYDPGPLSGQSFGPPGAHDLGPPPGYDPSRPPSGQDFGPPSAKETGPPQAGPPGGPPHGEPPPVSLGEGLRLLRFFGPYLWAMRGLVVLVVISTFVTAALILPMSFLPQMFTEHWDNREFLLTYLALTLGAVVLGWVLATLDTYWSSCVGEGLIRAMRRDAFGNLEKLKILGVYARGPGEFVQQAGRDVYVVKELLTEQLLAFLRDVGQGIVGLVAMFILHPGLTLILLAVFAVVGLLVRLLNRRVEQLAHKGRELSEETMNQLVENVGGFRDIVAAGRFQSFVQRFDQLLGESQKVNVKTAVWAQLAGLAPSILSTLAVLWIYLSGLYTYTEVREVGRILTFASLLGLLFPGLLALTRTTTNLAMATSSMRALRDILAQEPPSRGPVVPLTEPIRSLRFDGVCLDLEGRRIIDNMSFEIPPGKLTAIVGQSGSGKTTVFHLLLRLLDPTAGTILVNGQPVERFTLESLRAQIGFIPQNPFIFNQSLRENILLSSPEEVPTERLHKAVELSQLREVVERRAGEGGLEAVAGYMGSRLSGGEKQRLALARLILRDPQVVICDEYTANVDVRTARLIHEAMRTHFAGRTRVVITHELYTARGAEWIIVIDQGRVVQQGTPEHLAEQPGLYRELLEVQRV